MKDKLFEATTMPDRDWWSELWPDPKQVLSDLGIMPGMAVIDLCCGDGYFTVPLAQIADGNVYALDLDPKMLDVAKAAVASSGATVKGWIEGDALELARHVPEPVDYVVIANTFHGAPDKTGLAGAVAEILKPDGRFAIVNWHRRPREETPVLGKPRGPKTEMRMSPEDLRAVVEPAGFKIEEVIELPPYHYGAIFRKTAAIDKLRAESN